MTGEELQSAAEAISRLGARILGGTLIVLLGDLAAMAVYTVRTGKPAAESGKVIASDEPLSPMRPIGLGRVRALSKRRILGGRASLITIESLVDGTATTGERLMAAGIILFLFCFWLLWVALGMWLLPDAPFFIVMSIVPGVLVVNIYRMIWRNYVKARKKQSGQRKGG